MEGLRKTMDIIHDDLCLGRDLNRAPPPYKSEALPLNPAVSVVERAAAPVFTLSRAAPVEREHCLLGP
jgi:hypothetical protein